MADKQKQTHKFPSNNNISQNFYPNRNFGVLLSFISLFFLGILPIISNSRPSALNALNYSFYLSLWELICSLPLLFYEISKPNQGIFQKSIKSKIRKKTFIVMGITGIIFSFSTFFYVFAFETAGTVSAAIAIQTYPLFSILMEFILFKKKKQAGELIFTFIMILGIYYLGTEGSWLISGFSSWFALALIVPFLWSIAHVNIKHTLDTSPITPNQVTFFRVLISSILLFGFSSFVNGINNVLDGLMNLEFQIFGFLMGIVYYLELVNWFYAVKHVDVSVASAITTPTPVITMILAIFILKESIEFYQIIAMVIVFISLYGLLWSGRVKNHKK
ncbi:MAG: DMT family transporter [Promethearchaeota archaeon]|nr:MAG: DMT family transporter [Candidatus Lokiarchaeota archaeon]